MIPPVDLQTTMALGIFQSDVVIKTALVCAIQDLRANPYLLDYVFASLLGDDLTNRVYGVKEVQNAKNWFMRTDIPVVMDYHMASNDTGATISISLVESSEDVATLGDIHHDPEETQEADWPPLTSTFTPEAYDPATGIMTIPATITENLVLAPTMVVLDTSGTPHTISELIDSRNVVLDTDLNVDWTSSVIKGAEPAMIQQLESVVYKETYRIGIHIHGEASRLVWLYAIIKFCLLRYKQDYLEARGFERTVMSWAPFAKNEMMGPEVSWSRYVNLTGYTRDIWPKSRYQRVLSTGISAGGIEISPVGEDPDTFTGEPGMDEDDWVYVVGDD